MIIFITINDENTSNNGNQNNLESYQSTNTLDLDNVSNIGYQQNIIDTSESDATSSL